jgi:hypothetical protein
MGYDRCVGQEFDRQGPHSSRSYALPTAFAIEFDKRWSTSLSPRGSAASAIASGALMGKTTARPSSKLDGSGGSCHGETDFCCRGICFWYCRTRFADRQKICFSRMTGKTGICLFSACKAWSFMADVFGGFGSLHREIGQDPERLSTVIQ